MNLSVLECQSLGECLAARPGSPGSFVLSVERASLCGRFVQLSGGVGRVCSVCQHFSNPELREGVCRKSRIRGGIHSQRMGWY